MLLNDMIFAFYKNKINILDILDYLMSLGFDKETSRTIIKAETEIYNIRKNNKTKIKKHWWLESYKDKKIINKNVLIDDKFKYYIFYKNRLSENALYLDELLHLYNEAKYIIDNKIKIDSEDEFNKIYEICEYDNELSWVLDEIYSRFNYVYHFANSNIPREVPIDRRPVEKFIKEELNKINNQ